MGRIQPKGQFLAVALVAIACSGGTPETGATQPGATSTVSDSGASGSDSTAEGAPVGDETTTTVRSQEQLEAITQARTALNGQVAQATEPWPTDWALFNIDLADLQLGILQIDPRDVIPPIDVPEFESTEEAATWLEPPEPGALVQIEGEARFYSLSILHRHEIVNDTIAGVPVAVTYCPLCNTAIAFDRRLDGSVLRFGVSGLLRNSDLVMWDDQTVSLWQQVTGESIVGASTGRRLTPVSTSIVSFGDFAESFPDGLSLSRNTGFGLDYGANPYAGYSSGSGPFFPVTGEIDTRYPALERVVGVTIGDSAKAFPFSEINVVGVVNDTLGETPIVIFWGGDTLDALDTGLVATGRAIGTGVAYLSTVDGQKLTFSKTGEVWVDLETGTTWSLLGEAIEGPLVGERLEIAIHRNEFWFAWGAFFPDAAVYEG